MTTSPRSHSFIPGGRVMNRFVNPIVARLGLTPVLVVRGRTSGKLLRVPIGAPLEVDGARFLVSGRGETHWVRNLRAAGCGALRFKGRTEEFRATERPGEEQEHVVATYRNSFRGSSRTRLDQYFTEIPNVADHAVFRIDPL